MFPIRITALCAVMLTGCTYLPRGNYFSKGVAQYSGDGFIRDTSHRSLIFPSRGYVIDLADFDLGIPFQAQFRLVGLPIIKGSGVTIYHPLGNSGLRVADALPETFDAKLNVSLTDGLGQPVTKFSSLIRARRWPMAHGGTQYMLYWTWEPGTGTFAPRAGETYFLNIAYSPDATLKGEHAHVQLQSGCGGS